MDFLSCPSEPRYRGAGNSSHSPLPRPRRQPAAPRPTPGRVWGWAAVALDRIGSGGVASSGRLARVELARFLVKIMLRGSQPRLPNIPSPSFAMLSE